MTKQATVGGKNTKNRFIPYITDNPFRLLNVGSSTVYSDLRRRANHVSKALAAGGDLSGGADSICFMLRDELGSVQKV